MTEIQELLAGQRLASQHFPSTWTPEAQFDYELWTWHDAHHDTHYAVCVVCLEEWKQFEADELAKKTAMYNIAQELGL